MASPAETPGAAHLLHRVRIINPGPRSEHLAVAYDLEIDGARIHPIGFAVRFEAGRVPELTVTLPMVLETGELLAAGTGQGEPDENEPPLPECREEC